LKAYGYKESKMTTQVGGGRIRKEGEKVRGKAEETFEEKGWLIISQ
jgi:hypothetical protein